MTALLKLEFASSCDVSVLDLRKPAGIDMERNETRHSGKVESADEIVRRPHTSGDKRVGVAVPPRAGEHVSTACLLITRRMLFALQSVSL